MTGSPQPVFGHLLRMPDRRGTISHAVPDHAIARAAGADAAATWPDGVRAVLSTLPNGQRLSTVPL